MPAYVPHNFIGVGKVNSSAIPSAQPSVLANFALSIISSHSSRGPGQVSPNTSNSLKPLTSFITTVLHRTALGPSCVWLGMYLFDQLLQRMSAHPYMLSDVASPKSTSHLFLMSLILADKTLNDHTFTNASWSSVSGIPLARISEMEWFCLRTLEWNVHVDVAAWDGWVKRVAGWIAWTSSNIREQARQQYVAGLSWVPNGSVPILPPPTPSNAYNNVSMNSNPFTTKSFSSMQSAPLIPPQTLPPVTMVPTVSTGRWSSAPAKSMLPVEIATGTYGVPGHVVIPVHTPVWGEGFSAPRSWNHLVLA